MLKKKIRFQESVPTDFEYASGRLCFINIDDLLSDIYSKYVCELCAKGSHHRNISMNLITQNLFYQGRYCLEISLNAKSLVLLKNVRDKNQFMFLARQIYPEISNSLYKA